MTQYEDNLPALALVKNATNHEGSKHIDVAYMKIREWIERKRVQVIYLPTKDMLADFLTKPLNVTI